MELDLSHFDIEAIKSDKKIILETNGLNTILRCCKTVQEHNLFFGITGEPGFGKSLSFDYYRQKHPNVFFITVEKSMSSKDMYFDLARQLGIKEIDFSKTQLNPMIRAVSFALNNSGASNLIIIDEAGKFTARKLLFLHELRDATKESTGIIIAGPMYFRRKIESWTEDQREGIPELYRRIQSWINIDSPTKEEMVAFCKGKGIKDLALIKAMVNESKNFGDLDNKVTQARIFVLQELNAQKEQSSLGTDNKID
jgi:hypothetical protein